MTQPLYMKDNYLQEFDAVITAITEKGVILDRSAFYPESGGQSGDKGKLLTTSKEYEVKTTKKRNGMVEHRVDTLEDLEVGAKIHGILDWSWRYECMRFHTCQHILSRYLQLNYDLVTVGNMIKPGESRADYSPLNDFPDDMKAKVEAGVNEILSHDLDVVTKFMPRETAISYLREKGYQTRYLEMVPKHVKEFRVLLIGDYDAASCAGTHVKNTSEIGHIKLNKNKNVGANKQRIYFSLLESM
ncbi:MAG: hypothetical protein GF411_10185 [Candidatus Lokiarchaeota archaeon]|nr:hypothetical protein [Candidatus Lokiarchaeota archaeon]